MNFQKATQFIEGEWDDKVVPALQAYIAVPNLSPAYDPDILTNGYQESALQIMIDYVESKKDIIPNMSYEILTEEGKTPFLVVYIGHSNNGKWNASGDPTIVMYGHFDKQPHMDGWMEGLAPTKGVIRDDKLYGRGGADDGYALFTSISAIEALSKQGTSYPRIVITIEGCEESGSVHLLEYFARAKEQIGNARIVLALDSGCLGYQGLYVTSSLRGITNFDVTIDVCESVCHSGTSGGILPSCHDVFQRLLSRLWDPVTQTSPLGYLRGDVTEAEMENLRSLESRFTLDDIVSSLPTIAGIDVTHQSLIDILKANWNDGVVDVIGITGYPPAAIGGSAHIPKATFRISVRVPPEQDEKIVSEKVIEALTTDVPFNACVTIGRDHGGSGWKMSPLSPWLSAALSKASKGVWDEDYLTMGMGGSIPFMGSLAKFFSDAEFIATGLLGPMSNAHGPNEFLHIPYAKSLTVACAAVLAEAYTAFQE